MNDTNEKLNGSVKKGVSKEKLIGAMNIVLSALFGLILLACIIVALLNNVLHIYNGPAEANLVITQNLRSFLLILIPFILEKCFGIKLDYKLVFFLYLFGFCATVLGEAFRVYYQGIYWDKILHAISGCMQVYIMFGFAQAMLKSSPSKYKFGFALFIAFLGSMAIAAMWEILEFSSDVFLGSNMQKVMAFNDVNGDWNSKLDYGASLEEIGKWYQHAWDGKYLWSDGTGYRAGIMDTMMDMVFCFICSIGFIGVMIVVRLFKKNAFENSVVYNADYRFGFIKNRKKAKSANSGSVVTAESADDEAAVAQAETTPVEETDEQTE